MIRIILLWLAGIFLAFVGIILKVLYKPVRKVADLFLTLFFMFMLFVQLSAVYFTAQKAPFVAAIGIIFFLQYWFNFAPFYPNSDPAGNGMARGFRAFFHMVASIILGLVSFLLIRFVNLNGGKQGLYIVLGVAALIGLWNILANQKSYVSGDSFEEDARWERMSVDDYRKTLFRKSMVERRDSWEAKELDAVPKELKHWNVYGCNSIRVTTYDLYPALLVEGKIELSDETHEIPHSGFQFGCLGSTGGEDTDDPDSTVPNSVMLVWHDLAEGKTYKLQAVLPKELNRYFADRERFEYDDIEFRIMPTGRVLMFHNRINQIHNIMIDYPLQGEVTDDYEKDVSDLIEKNNIDISKCTAVKIPSAETISDYTKRFRYHISFLTENDSLKITKTICNFFNGEKILSGGTWEEEMDPSRIKDVFLRFESEKRRYACFIYFNEDEINRAFEEICGNGCDGDRAEFTVTVGSGKGAFAAEISLGKKHFLLKKTEIRLYTVNKDERGKLVFKNYNGRHKNRLKAMVNIIPEYKAWHYGIVL